MKYKYHYNAVRLTLSGVTKGNPDDDTVPGLGVANYFDGNKCLNTQKTGREVQLVERDKIPTKSYSIMVKGSDNVELSYKPLYLLMWILSHRISEGSILKLFTLGLPRSKFILTIEA